MQQNQRARLVLGSFTLVLVLLAIGLTAGIGIARHRNRATSETSAESASASDGIVLSSDSLDFGEIALSSSAARQLLLRTTGSNPIAVRIEGTSSFSVEPRELRVEPGLVARVTVTANPTVAGSFKDELRIFTGGRSKASMVVALQGNARASGMAIAQADVPGSGASSATESGARGMPGQDVGSGADAPGLAARDAAGGAAGSVQITRSTSEGGEASAGDVDARSARAGNGQNPGMVVVPYDPAASAHRSISDRPNVLSPEQPPREGEQPAPVESSKKPGDLDPKKKDPSEEPPATPTFVISHTSTLTVLGSRNQFYPQQLGVSGSASGGSFSLGASLQLPRVPIAFGQTMIFNQTGAPSGTFDPTSGQVTLLLGIEAVDPNGNAAPFQIPLTTGAVQRRNNNGVLIQLVGQPRARESGLLRLVGIEKIPARYRNSAEEQFVMVEIWASLNFPSAPSSDGSAGGN